MTNTLSDLELPRAISTRILELDRACTRMPISACIPEEMSAAVAAPEHLATMIACALDTSYVQFVAEQSYSHDNGFTKLVFYKGAACSLRFHLWDTRNGEQVVSNIHDHRWSFFSKLLRGEYEQELFDASDSDDAVLYRRHRYVAGTDHYSIVPDGTARLQCRDSRTFSAGMSYSLLADTLHRVSVSSSTVAISVVVQGPIARESCRVFARGTISQRIVRKGGLDPVEASELLKVIYDTCSHGSNS